MLDYFAASQSEVIRAIVSGCSQCCGPRTAVKVDALVLHIVDQIALDDHA